MEIDSLILLFILVTIAALVGLFFVFWKISRKTREEYERSRKYSKPDPKLDPKLDPKPDPAPDPKPKSDPKPVKWDKKAIPVDPNKKTIYEYRSTGAHCLCAYCDGENAVGATNCVICGHAIR